MKRPKPIAEAHVGWAIDAANGPIFGERIEQFKDSTTAERAVNTTKVQLPCEFTLPDGSRWRSERLAPPAVGGSGRITLLTSRDRADSYNYQVKIRSGSVVVSAVLNIRYSDPSRLERLVGIAWRKARNKGVVQE